MQSRIALGVMLLCALHAGSSFAQQFVDRTVAFFDEQAVARLPGGHASFADINHDGWVDLHCNGFVYVNLQGTGFGTVGRVGNDMAVWGDADNDGRVDLFSIADRKFFRNGGNLQFTQIPQFLPPMPMRVSRGAAWADFDNDGYLDLYVGGYESPRYEPDMILSNRVKAFTTSWIQTLDLDPARGITCADFDLDGDQDIYVSNYRLEANRLWLNDGQGNFLNHARQYGVDGDNDGSSISFGHTIGSAWGDLDDDGLIDLFVGNFSHAWGHPIQDQSKFYRNRGANLKFEDKSSTVGLPWQESYATPALGDFDNDGDLDLYFTTVYSGDNPVFYRNEGNWRFTNQTASVKLGALPPTYMAAWADVDNDGDLDLMTAGRLFINQGNPNNWVKLRLDGRGASFNRSAIGAQARIKLGGGPQGNRTLTRQVEAGTGEANQNDLTLHFGLGQVAGPVTVDIRWPDGTHQSVVVEVNRTTTITPTLLKATGRTRPGDTVALELRAGLDEGFPYRLATSFGTGPIQIDARELGLDFDVLCWVSGFGFANSIFVDYVGIIGPTGTAQASIKLPNLPILIGVSLHTAFITMDLSAPSGISSVSNTVSFTVSAP